MSRMTRSMFLVAVGTCLFLLLPQISSGQDGRSTDRFDDPSARNDARSVRENPRQRVRERITISDDLRLIRPPIGSLPPRRPAQDQWQLGVHADTTSTGMLITSVVRGSAADRVGLERGDRIIAVGDERVGLVGNRTVSMRQVLRRQADSRGDVLLLVKARRTRGLINVSVRLDGVGGPQFFSD